jgi:hypothetical protein
MTIHHTCDDFVSTDAAALASHMRSCADKRGRFFGFHVAMEPLHALIFPRLLTFTMVAVLLIAVTSIA